MNLFFYQLVIIHPGCVDPVFIWAYRDSVPHAPTAEHRVVPHESLLLRSAMSEARTISDPAGNSKLSKSTQGDRRLRARDDAACAAILTVAAGVRQTTVSKLSWRYRGVAWWMTRGK